MNFTYYFPYKNYRPHQYNVIQSILEAVDEDYPYIIVDAPTGFGKSGVVRTVNETLVAEDGYKSFILTATKNLQYQYYVECMSSEHVDYAMMLGRANHKCLINNSTADLGYCKTKPSNEQYKCVYGISRGEPCSHKGCPYWKSKCENIVADTSIMNYNVLMADLLYANHFHHRGLMFCDEAHNIEDKIMGEVTITLSDWNLRRLFGLSFNEAQLEKTDIDYWIDYIEGLLKAASDKLDIIQSPYSDIDTKTAEEIHSFARSLEWKLKEIKHSGIEWIVCPNKRGRVIELKPLTIERYTHNYLLDASFIHIFLSGTFVDIDQWAKDLGIEGYLTKYIKTKSGFDMKNNNPIYRRWVGNMSMKQKSKTLPKMIVEVQKILNDHKDQCGIIHCHSKDNAMYLMNNLNDGRLISYNDSFDKEKKLKVFEESNNLVMCGYSLEEGVDLPYDNVRFQIFLKTPFANLGDNQIRARMKKDKRWYEVNTSRKLLQAWGRGMRAEDDWCENYMLDTGFNAIIHKDFMPEEFKEALQ